MCPYHRIMQRSVVNENLKRVLHWGNVPVQKITFPGSEFGIIFYRIVKGTILPKFYVYQQESHLKHLIVIGYQIRGGYNTQYKYKLIYLYRSKHILYIDTLNSKQSKRSAKVRQLILERRQQKILFHRTKSKNMFYK